MVVQRTDRRKFVLVSNKFHCDIIDKLQKYLNGDYKAGTSQHTNEEVVGAINRYFMPVCNYIHSFGYHHTAP